MCRALAVHLYEPIAWPENRLHSGPRAAELAGRPILALFGAKGRELAAPECASLDGLESGCSARHKVLPSLPLGFASPRG